MGWNFRTVGSIAAAVSVSAVFTSPISHADDGWVAVADSPSHEQRDWGYGPDQAIAEAPDIQVRCTWWPRTNPNPRSPGTPLATLFT